MISYIEHIMILYSLKLVIKRYFFDNSKTIKQLLLVIFNHTFILQNGIISVLIFQSNIGNLIHRKTVGFIFRFIDVQS